MGITKPKETPALVAGLIHHHHPSASFRLALLRELLLGLHDDMVELGFPSAAQVMDVTDSGVADVQQHVATRLDRVINEREVVAAARVKVEEISLVEARADFSHSATPSVADVRFANTKHGAFWVGVMAARKTIPFEDQLAHEIDGGGE